MSQVGDGASLTELMQLQEKLQEALSLKGNIARCKGKMPSVLSNSSISTMAPEEDEDGEAYDLEDTHDENDPFELNVEEDVVSQTPIVSSADTLPVHQMNTQKQPADQRMQNGPAPQHAHSHVPRNLNLAEEYQRSHSSSVPPTTLMIRNIPNRYTQRELITELEEIGLGSSFDFLYLPIDKGTTCNIGYAFVNFVNPTWAAKCATVFEGYPFKRHRNVPCKIAAVSVAHIQGLEKNLAYYEKSVVNTSKKRQRRPVVVAQISNMLA